MTGRVWSFANSAGAVVGGLGVVILAFLVDFFRSLVRTPPALPYSRLSLPQRAATFNSIASEYFRSSVSVALTSRARSSAVVRALFRQRGTYFCDGLILFLDDY
jgi:hypothetical protein